MGYTEDRIGRLGSEQVREQLRYLYGSDESLVSAQRERCAGLLRRHAALFGEKETVQLISAPGRTEIGGNHTDHNHGRVLAAAVNLDALCAVSPREDRRVRFHSEGYEPLELDLDDLSPRGDEQGTTAALIRGVAAGMADAGYRTGGFDAAVTSTVAGGSGLSSSAALEVMLTGVLDSLYNRFDMPFTLRAQISQKAENAYFGKPSGLLDQMASAAGGLVSMDFRDTEHPQVEPLSFDFAEKGYALVVVATGGSHANLTEHYAAIPAEMKSVAACFGQEVLRGLTAERLTGNLKELRARVSDRALLRAYHFIREDERVPKQVAALREERIGDFFTLVRESGRSSYMYLQNVYADVRDQSLCLALCLAEELLGEKGAWRIHGGGFAGTTLNFVPLAEVADFVGTMDSAFGAKACTVLNIRPVGAARMV